MILLIPELSMNVTHMKNYAKPSPYQLQENLYWELFLDMLNFILF